MRLHERIHAMRQRRRRLSLRERLRRRRRLVELEGVAKKLRAESESEMIEPTTNDIGRSVVYTGNRYPGGKLVEGVITSFNDYSVFVRYGAEKHSKATSRADLEWAREN
jgi:hypothetical protein